MFRWNKKGLVNSWTRCKQTISDFLAICRAEKRFNQYIEFYEQKSVIMKKIIKTMVRYQKEDNSKLDCHALL